MSLTEVQAPTFRILKLSLGKETLKRRHYKSFQKIKVNGIMNEVRVSLSHSTRRKIIMFRTGRAVVVSGKSVAGLLVKKTNQEQSTNVKYPTASNCNYGKWLIGKSL